MRARSIGDFATARENLYTGVQEAAAAIQPVTFGDRMIRVVDVSYDADDDAAKPERYDYEAQTKAIYGRRTLGRSLRGTYELVNTTTGDVIDRQRRLLARVPRVNEDGAMIYRGSRYAMVNQTRVKPAVFARRKKNEETESYVNVKTGTGPNHRLILNPETGVYFFNLQHSRIPLVDVLKVLGATEDEMRAAWGDEIADSNFKKRDPKAITKIWERLVPKHEQSKGGPKEDAIRAAFDRMRVDPWSMRRTIGMETDRVTKDSMLAATKRVLSLSRGEDEGDDRDHLAYQTFHALEDLIPERIAMDKDRLQRKQLLKAVRNQSISKIPTGLLQKQIESAIFSSGLGVQPEYSNPLDALDRATRLSKMGEGGLPSSQSTPMESRDVHASQVGFVDLARTAESLKVGVDLNLTMNSVRGSDGKLYRQVRNARTGELEFRTPEELSEAVLQLSPDVQSSEADGYVGVIRNGRETYALPNEVDYVIDSPAEDLFSFSSVLVPNRSAIAPHRLAMGARMLSQALPLARREAPVVQTEVPGTGQSYYDELSHIMGTVRSPVTGMVKQVTPSFIELVSHSGETRKIPLRRLMPLGSKTGMWNIPKVQVGDVVRPNQLLATSNFTDDNGTIALTRNARIAFMPFEDNFEDTFVVSRSFADAMASEHLYRARYTPELDHRRTKHEYTAALPAVYSKEQLGRLDDTGVIKLGQKVSFGDPLILAAQPLEKAGGRVLRKGSRTFADRTRVWDHDDPGEVVDVYQDESGETVVAVKAVASLQDGDKIAGMFGDKGVVKVLPDEKMIQDSEGRPFDIVASDLGLISRENPGRAYTAFLGKVAAKRGKPYLIKDFQSKRLSQLVSEEMKKHDVSGYEEVVNPSTNRRTKVGTGILPMMKLTHLAEAKAHARGIGRYTNEGLPSKGSEDDAQAKRLSNQELNALISHGAYEFLREGALVRGQGDAEYWARYLNGHEPPTPKRPWVFDKFLGYLKGMGINPVTEGTKTKLMLWNDRDIEEQTSGREVTSADTLDFHKDGKELPGGLFDPKLFGSGDLWAAYRLAEPIPHPMLEDPIRNLMGVTKDQYRKILSGQEAYKDFGTGPAAFQKFLGSLNLSREIAVARRDARDDRKTRREAAVKRLRYLRGLADRDIDPTDLMVSKVPILPPRMRPISILRGKGTPLIDGMNLLYRDLIEADKNLRKVGQFSDDVSTDRLAVYDAVQAAFGLREPIDPELRQKKVLGLLKRVVGNDPKSSFVSRKLLSGTVDAVGRAVVLPSHRFKMNEIGIPEEQAWKIYQAPVLRELRRRGVPMDEAILLLKRRAPQAKKVLLDEMDRRPVMASRAPVLHKFGIMAFEPKIVTGTTLVVNPLVHEAYNLDHDGDTMNFHVILGDAAAKEAREKTLPSRMLISPRNFRKPMFVPRQDHAAGLYLASVRRSSTMHRPQIYKDMSSLRRAVSRGEIDFDAITEVLE